MDEELPPGEAVAHGDLRAVRTDAQAACAEPARSRPKPGRHPAARASEPLTLELFRLTRDHFFPCFNRELAQLADPRAPPRCTYSFTALFYLGLSLFTMPVGTRRQLGSACRAACVPDHLATLSDEPCPASVAQPDTLNYLLRRLPPAVLDGFATRLTMHLCRGKVLDKFRLDGELLVAIDGVNVLSHQRTPPTACRWETARDGHRRYRCDALEAKIVTAHGLALHLATEFIEAPLDTYDKQDCELQAFSHLAAPSPYPTPPRPGWKPRPAPPESGRGRLTGRGFTAIVASVSRVPRVATFGPCRRP